MNNNEICVVREEDIPENEKYLYGHLVIYQGKEWIRLRPSYWLYNAGIVGIIRAIEEMKKIVEEWESDEDGKTLEELKEEVKELEKEEEKLKSKIDEKIKKYLDVIIYLRCKKEINEEINDEELEGLLSELCDNDRGDVVNKVKEISESREGKKIEFTDVGDIECNFENIEQIKNLISENSKGSLKEIEKEVIKNALISDEIEKIENIKYKIIITLFFDKKNKHYKFLRDGSVIIDKWMWSVLPEIYVNVMNQYFTGIDNGNIWYNKFFSKSGWFPNRINISTDINKYVRWRFGIRNRRELFDINDRDRIINVINNVNKFISYILTKNEDIFCINNMTTICSFCGIRKNQGIFFNLRKFKMEGGSSDRRNGFENFYWGNNTGILICDICNLVLYFIPISIYKEKSFVNVNDVELLWELNKYVWEIKEVEEEDQENKEKNRLVEAIVSVGNILSLKAKWTLQNIELIEISGAKKDTVYTIRIGETASMLLSSFNNKKVIKWLNDIRSIYINKKNGYLVKGIELLDAFVEDNVSLLIKKLLWLFYDYLKFGNNWGLNSLTNLVISLYEKDIYDETYYWFGRRFYYVIKDKEIRNVISYYFSLVRKLDKNTLVNEIVKEYVRENKEVDRQLLNLLDKRDEEFQIYALSFLSGIVDVLNQSEN